MASSQTMQIAEALATWANGVTSAGWLARSSPAKDLDKITSRIQYVWPFSREVELQTRGGGKEVRPEFALAIADRLPVPPADPEAFFDAEIKRMEDLADLILGEAFKISGDRSVTFINVRHEPLFARDLLETHRVVACAIVAGALIHFDS